MTNEEWAVIERELGSLYGHVELLVDGYELKIRVLQLKMRLVIVCYVNGYLKGEWLIKKSDECIRFFRPIEHSLYSPKQKKILTKGMSARRLKTLVPNFDKKETFYTFEWLSFKPFKRHLLANNKSIVLVSLGGAYEQVSP